jgi:hypothetical protein
VKPSPLVEEDMLAPQLKKSLATSKFILSLRLYQRAYSSYMRIWHLCKRKLNKAKSEAKIQEIVEDIEEEVESCVSLL